MIPLRLQTVFTIAMCAAFACCALLSGQSVVRNLSSYQNLRLGSKELARFHLALDAADAVSAERAPSNSAMGPSAENQQTLLDALAAKRIVTDGKIEALRLGFRDDIAVSTRISGLLTSLSLHLAEGRLAVDAVANKPLAQRSSSDVVQAIEAMFRAADAATVLRDSLGETIVALAPEVGTEVMLGAVVGSLRERAGRMGSYVVMMLSSVAQEDQRLLSRLQRGAGELRQLHDMIATYAVVALPSEDMRRAMHDVETYYFRAALPFAERTAANEALDNSISASAFTREYVPGIRYVEALRHRILEASTEKLDTLKADAFERLVSAVVLIAGITAILIVLAVIFKRSLFNPLLIARRHVLAIAEGDLTEPDLKGSMSPEVREMFNGLTVLRQQQWQKRDLESEQARLLVRLKMLAERDYLTGLRNRRAIESDALHLIAKTERDGKTLALLLVDIDHFKKINDTFGHDIGDIVLQKVARIFEDGIRPGDAVSRFGGEEFLILLDGAGEVDAMAIADRLRRDIARAVIDHHPDINITASFGVALRPAGCGLNWNTLVQTADRRLYAAKRAGRNRIAILDEDEMAHEPRPVYPD